MDNKSKEKNQSPGYFAQQGQWIFVGMFGVLLICALAGVRIS